MDNDIKGFMSFLEKSVSPHHAVKELTRILDEAGFAALEQNEPWEIEKGKNYYVKCFGTMLAAFHIGMDFIPGEAFRLAGSHVDWPCYYIKPNPEKQEAGCLKFSVEPYGGMICSAWFDRPLSCAGTATVKTDNALAPKRLLVDFEKPVFTIPNLCIHMNRDVNKGVELNPNKDMLPLGLCVPDNFEKKGYFVKKLAELLNVEPESILSYDLCLYNAEKPMLCGFNGEFLTSGRLDNLSSVYAALYGITRCRRRHGITASIFFDNEEVGSGTKQGADSATLKMTLEKLSIALGVSRCRYIDSLTGGFMLSCDGSHAKHPNYPEYSDGACVSLLNGGVTIKMNYSQRYATEAAGIGMIAGICEKYKIPYQRYMNRPDLRGGGTLGSFAASRLGMSAADIGAPMLAMHSCRETMCVSDQIAANELLMRYFNEE